MDITVTEEGGEIRVTAELPKINPTGRGRANEQRKTTQDLMEALKEDGHKVDSWECVRDEHYVHNTNEANRKNTWVFRRRATSAPRAVTTPKTQLEETRGTPDTTKKRKAKK